MINLVTSKERVSKRFAEHLFEYPLPEETSLISKHQFNGKNFLDGGGSGGYWDVVAIMELRTALTKEEVLAYYQNAELFPFPKGEQRGVELELYFEDNSQKIAIHSVPSGFYYRDNGKRISTISTYPFEATNSHEKQQEREIQYVLQLTSGFNYFLNMD